MLPLITLSNGLMPFLLAARHKLIHHPVGWLEALLLESLGQPIRGAAFAIPGALRVYLHLCSRARAAAV
jgi:hypothetical protein